MLARGPGHADSSTGLGLPVVGLLVVGLLVVGLLVVGLLVVAPSGGRARWLGGSLGWRANALAAVVAKMPH